MEKSGAIVLTNGMLAEADAKTAHGLIRGTERYTIAAVIDHRYAGQDAGKVLDGNTRNIPVLASIEEAVTAIPGIQFCIIGIATVGGVLPPDFMDFIKKAIQFKLSIVNGLHEYLSDKHELVEMALEYGVELIDIRRPKKRADLHFWSGEIFSVTVPIIAVLGMDCAMGKRTTARLIRQACEEKGLNAAMIYTGQTGWLQGGKYGFIFDSTLNDFISGEIEQSIVRCWKETQPQLILLEGQSALRNPSGPCGSELLVSGNAAYTVLVYAPKRIHFEHDPAWGEIPTLASEISLIQMYGSQVIAIALNTEDCTSDEAFLMGLELENELGIPVLLPLQDGVGKMLPVIEGLLKN